jgi:NAD(P)-dependent dehydrogenase (short-subunit alcohol dehydrogenase family)
VAATVRNAEALADLKTRHGARLSVAILDLTDVAAVRRGVDEAFALFGRIDVVVSNAAYAVFGAAEEANDEQVAHQIATNLTGSIALIRACLPHLRAQGGGHVLQVSSEGGQITYPGFSLYHATRWGVEGFVEAVAKETAPFGIAFTLVEPGPASTNFGRGLVRPAPLAAYAGAPSDQVRRAIDTGAFTIIGDPDKMVDAMIAVADGGAPPLRLTLGSSSFDAIHAALTARRDALEAQREIAFSTDHVLQ